MAMNTLVSEYHPHTLRSSNLERLSFLPCFPPKNKSPTHTHHEQETLLLANVPGTMLSSSQLAQRQTNAYERQFLYIENKNSHVPSFLKFIYRNFIYDLSKKLKVSESILDFNLLRLNGITAQVARTRNGYHHSYNLNMAYHMHEWPMALEIFLQIDIDSLYMKTCTFRGAHPRSIERMMKDSTTQKKEEEEGLFCIEPPDARYLMLPCTNSLCPCCYQSLDISCRHEPSVQFANEEGHRFINGYKAYLNYHASCKTTNFIYVLICPCGQFDYIGSSVHSKETFKDVLFHHRRESVRILHEFLLGEKIIKRTRDMYEREKTNDEKRADKMYLYQHLTECSAAVQLLLNRTAAYWPFIPMEMAEADREDQQQQESSEENTISFNDHSQICSPHERTDEEVQWCLTNIPKTPHGTRFSRLQHQKQKDFFKYAWDLLCLPPRHLDIFTMTIVFVLPDDCSQLLCAVIESLLITHAECKLNTDGHLTENEQTSNSDPWYKNLVGRHYKS